MSPVPAVTLANQITLLRILLIPVFVGLALYYFESMRTGAPNDSLRWLTVVVFGIAAIGDALDGYIARHYNQITRLGVILDPLADKLLMVSAVAILTLGPWPVKLPIWYAMIVVAKEVFSTIGAFVINFEAGKVHIAPHWTGKISTFLGFFAIGFALLCLPQPIIWWSALIAAIFGCITGAVYVMDAVRQIQSSDHGSSKV